MTESPTAEPGGRLSRLARSPLDVVRGTARALPRAVEDLYADRCPQYAAAIAYRVLFSLFPLTIFLVAIFGLVLQDATIKHSVENELLDVLPLSDKGRDELLNSIEGIASPLSAIGLVSLIALLWGASGMMAAIRVGLDTACKVERGRPAVHAKAIDLLLVAITGLLVLIVVGLSAFAAFFGRLVDRAAEHIGVNASPSGVLLRDVLQLLVFSVMALLLYRFVPTNRLRTRAALSGAVVAGLLAWSATKVLSLVFEDSSRYNTIYLSLAGVMVFLFFVYVVALILLFGAEFAYAWSQPPGPPGPPLRSQLLSFLRGLFVAPREEPEQRAAPD